MLDGIQVSNKLTIDMSKAHVLENLLGYWMVSVSYMSAKMEIQFPPRSGVGIKHKVDIRISKFDSKIGCGRGRGKVRGRGSGSRGSHHSRSNRHDPAYGWFHGVDCSDFRRRFSGKEFDKAGSNGRLFVLNRRKSDKDTHHTQKVKQGGNDYGKEPDLVPYSREATVNDNSGGNEKPNEPK